MPMIMEEQIYEEKFDDLEDLFLDPPPALIEPPTLSKEVLQRVDELAISCCCQKVAWSKTGVIARITRNGQAVVLQTSLQDHILKESTLSQIVPLELPPFHNGVELVHVSWSNLGHELAIVDANGGLTIFQPIYGLLNRMTAVGSHVPEPVKASSTVISLEWLNTNTHRPSQFQYYAKRSGSKWIYPSTTHAFRGPIYPIPRGAALVFVTRLAVVHLLFAPLLLTPDNPYDETSIALEGIEDQQNLLTHVSIAAENGPSFLVATCDVSLLVCVYQVGIQWNFPYSGKDPLPREFRMQPTLEVSKLKTFNLLSLDGPLPNFSLLHFHILPFVASQSIDTVATDTVLAIFSGNDNSMGDSPVSRVIRYALHQKSEQLHSSFEQLATRKKKPTAIAPLNSIFTVTRLSDTDIHGIVINSIVFQSNAILALSKSDGSTLFFDRSTMQQIQKDERSDTIHTIMDAGFSFAPGEQYCNIALSPNGCAFAIVHEDDDLVVQYMEYHSELNDSSLLPAKADACSAVIALMFATAQGPQQSHNDIVALIQKNLAKINIEDLFENMFIAVNVYFDYSSDASQRLLNSSAVPRCLALQYLLGNREAQQSVPSQIAWVLMNLRQAAWAMHIGFGSTQRDDGAQFDLPAFLFGIVEWYSNLMCSLLDDLFWISRKLNHDGNNLQLLQEIIDFPESATLALLLTTVARTFFRWRFLRNIDSLVQQRAANSQPNETQSWRAFVDTVANSPIPFARFDGFLAEIDHYVKKAYDDAGWSNEVRGAAERGMVISGRVPTILLPVVQRVLTSALDKVLSDVEKPGRLLHGKATNLVRALIDEGREPKWDVSRKVPLCGVKEIKKCTMCGSFAENLVPRLGKFPQWVLSLQKICVCGNAWQAVDL